jgi:hypothetical protein
MFYTPCYMQCGFIVETLIRSMKYFCFIFCGWKIKIWIFIYKIKLFNNMELRKFIKTTIREYLNEQQILNESDKPPMMGTQYNQVNILYKLTNDDFSYVPSSLEYLSINTDRTLLGKCIYYGGKRYSYDRHSKILKDKSGNKIRASEQDDVFNQQMNQIIHNTVNPTKSIDVF